ncbi:MAG: M18 family aminopeptidase [Prevotellaceae bacterium]|nr:M18 family aminopeptidase [Prevotellaceae bacterium]MDY5210109.1 M18 family aminopeptidase [Prevotella sp.]
MTTYTEKLIGFLNASPVNFLAVRNVCNELLDNGFVQLKAEDAIRNLPEKFFITKNESAVFAFHLGRSTMADAGFHIIAAHSDSPTFRIKPNAEMTGEGGMVRLNTEAYGGSILNTWFDRPLSLAGRVILRSDDALMPETRLLHIKRPLLVIPNLAIHFNRQVNDGVKLNKQKDMLPILGYVNDKLEGDGLLIRIIADELKIEKERIIDFDLYLYDTTPACLVGLNNEFVSSGRLDDLSMVHAGLEAMTAEDGQADVTRVLAVFDNEETGSGTKQGAGSNFLMSLIQRIVIAQGGCLDDYFRSVEKAFMVSADNAHGFHPNYVEKYDPTNHALLGGGPVIKINAAQKYATDAMSAAAFQQICERAGVPCQRFVNRSDIAGGSTLGNILTSSIAIRGVDMGNPVLAMHSVRELASASDHENCIKAFIEFYK